MSGGQLVEDVEIVIAGRRFRLQCGAGETPRVQALARHVDTCATSLIQGQPGLGEEKLLLFTTLMLADRLEDALAEVDQLEREVGRAATVIRERGEWAVRTAARRLDALARKIEQASESGGGGQAIAGRGMG